MKFQVLQKSALPKGPIQKLSAKAAAASPLASGAIVIGTDGTATVMGLHQSGVLSDISDLATLTGLPASDNTAVLTVGTPIKMTFSLHGVSPGNANITGIVATWNDGSVGPFAADPVPTTVENVPDPFTGLKVTINP